MSKYKVVTSRPLPLPEIKLGDDIIQFQVYEGDVSVFEGAQAFLTTVLEAISSELIESLPSSVTLIANIGVGIDNVDLNAAAKRNITVTNTPVVTEDTADLAFAIMLAAARQVSKNEQFLRAGGWNRQQPMAAMGTRVHGKTLGIVGFGDIGQAMARRAKGFGMEIIYHGPNPKPEAEQALNASYYADLNDMLANADFVSLHCPLTTATQKIINQQSIQHMRDGAVFVNTGRGPLVDDEALISALKNGKLAAAGLDVFDSEPDFNQAYLELENVTLTPHIGSATNECRQHMVQRALQNVLASLQNKPVIDRV